MQNETIQGGERANSFYSLRQRNALAVGLALKESTMQGNDIDSDEKVAEILRTIKRIREERGISQRQLASMMDMDAGSWNKIENGQMGIKVPTVFRIAEALEIDPAVLLGRYSEPFNHAWELFSRLSPERQARILDQIADLAALEDSRQ